MRDFPRKLRAGDTNGKEAAERREYLDALSTWSRFLSSPFLEVKYVGPEVGFGVYLRMQGRQCQPTAGRQKPQRPHRHPAVVAVEHLQGNGTQDGSRVLERLVAKAVALRESVGVECSESARRLSCGLGTNAGDVAEHENHG